VPAQLHCGISAQLPVIVLAFARLRTEAAASATLWAGGISRSCDVFTEFGDSLRRMLDRVQHWRTPRDDPDSVAVSAGRSACPDW
jgi:hypothetical protein